ncbi:MAG: alkaline phosphatase family protein [Ruminococcus sp.]|nr:alkaline phosphatase family protein [Ruminococcus sp.]
MLVYPNYKKSVINVIASIRKFYRIGTNVPTLPELDKVLRRMYKNVVLIILGGAGENMLKDCLLPGDTVMENMSGYVTSVCPCCPAAAEVSCLTGLSPSQHGRLGQTMFFKELCRTVELSSNLDPYAGQPVAFANIADFVIPYENIFGEIADSIIGGVQPFSIAPKGVKIAENKSYHKIAESPTRMFDLIDKIADTDQNTFTFVLWDAPAKAAAKYGCKSDEVRRIVKDIADTVGGLSRTLTDTVFILTSSYGMTDITEEYMLNSYPAIGDCLVMPPTFGVRAVNFFVKYDRRSDFERLFTEEFSDDFILMSRSEILRKELLGTGRHTAKVYDFLGDYTAFAISDKSLRFRALNEKHRPADKAAFGGFTSDEMCMPLSVIATKQTSKWKRPFIENISPASGGAAADEE